MAAKFTPGPWSVGYRVMDVGCVNAKIGGYAKLFDVRGWGYLTGTGHGGLALDPDEAVEIQTANAHLISAAPDLYAALEQAEQIVGRLPVENYIIEPFKAIQAALRKARGEQP